MAQVQGPPPTIDGVQSLNQSLLVTWTLEPYTISPDATLLVINTNTNTMASYLLNSEEILMEEYLVTGLVNGDSYAILFSVLDGSGNTHNSNTANGIPSDIPSNPTIVSYELQPPSYTSVIVNAILGVNTGLPVTSLVFRILREGSIITSQAFVPNLLTNTYELINDASGNPFIEGSDYIISCQALNAVGYSNVSNSISFRNGDFAGTPVLGTIQSGSNQFALLPVSGTNTSTNDITSFKVYNNNTFLRTLSVTPVIAQNATYSLDLSLNNITNETPYYLTVTAVTNSVDESAKSNTSTVVPALQLAFSNAVITFPSTNQIRIDFSNNNASWVNPSREVVLGFSGANVPQDASGAISVYNVNTYTYTLPTGSSLVAGSDYTVTINGYCIVPQTLYPGLWVSPSLFNNEYAADTVTVSETYAIAPSAVTNLAVTTDIINDLGIIQATWLDGSNNGSPITSYTCNLYTVSGGNRTLIDTTTTTAKNCLFNNLQVTGIFYSIGVVANNSVGSSTEANYPVDTQIGFPITGSVDGVTNLQGYQTYYAVGGDFSGNLTWDYAGPGSGYTNAVFHIYSVVNGSYNSLGTRPYVTGTLSYAFPVSLGNTANVPQVFAVDVTASTLTGSSTSIYSYVTITPGVAPVISNVTVSAITSDNWRLTFTVTNQTSAPMIQDGIVSLVMPDPISDISTINPVYNLYDVTLVDTSPTRSFTYVHDLGYTALSNDYVLITAANANGESIYGNRWGS
jgi:hypothetical protein